MKTILKAFICLMLLFAFSCGGGDKSKNVESVEESVEESVNDDFEVEDAYKCPMDCEEGEEYNEEGTCPVCGMELKHVNEETHNDSEGHDDEDEDHEDHEGESKTEHDFDEE